MEHPLTEALKVYFEGAKQDRTNARILGVFEMYRVVCDYIGAHAYEFDKRTTIEFTKLCQHLQKTVDEYMKDFKVS